MKRKLILMAIIAFSGFSIEANAAVNDEALSNVQNKMIEYINNYSFTNNADESATEGTTNNTVDFNGRIYNLINTNELIGIVYNRDKGMANYEYLSYFDVSESDINYFYSHH